jgi:hypothetical protein
MDRQATRRGIADFVPRPEAARRHLSRLGLSPRDDVAGSRRRTMGGH